MEKVKILLIKIRKNKKKDPKKTNSNKNKQNQPSENKQQQTYKIKGKKQTNKATCDCGKGGYSPMKCQSRVYLRKHHCVPGILLLTSQMNMAGSGYLSSQVH